MIKLDAKAILYNGQRKVLLYAENAGLTNDSKNCPIKAAMRQANEKQSVTSLEKSSGIGMA